MKLKIITATILVVCIAGLGGCYKDVIYPDFDPNAPISFNADLVPIFTKSCDDAGCHDAAATHNPALTADKAYNAIKNGGFINLLKPEESILYKSVKSGAMPPSGGLKPADVQRILIWIKNGAPNN
ncbi:MAG: hypothetical protein SFU87_01505 [Chitinophagaceae bacterium]|nr:hypothetical protein [Chitinophagaceae bacterium]